MNEENAALENQILELEATASMLRAVLASHDGYHGRHGHHENGGSASHQVGVDFLCEFTLMC